MEQSPRRWRVECVSLEKEDDTSFDMEEKEGMSGEDSNFLGKRV